MLYVSGMEGECWNKKIEVFFFVVKQKTAYEMRISDWSSDVSSSDLSDGAAYLHRCAETLVGEADHGCPPLFRLCKAGPDARAAHSHFGQAGRQSHHHGRGRPRPFDGPACGPDSGLLRYTDRQYLFRRSDKRHVGKKGARTAKSRWSQ